MRMHPVVQPTPHKGGNTVELPPWKKGWHRPVAPQYARPDFMRCRSPPGTGLWPHNMWGPTLCGAAPPFRLHCSRYQVWGGAAPHIPMPCIFQCHGPVPPPFPWRHILCVFSMLNWLTPYFSDTYGYKGGVNWPSQKGLLLLVLKSKKRYFYPHIDPITPKSGIQKNLW